MAPVINRELGAVSYRSTSRRLGVVLLGVYAVLTWKLFQTIHTETVNIFYMDQWDFNDPILFHPQSLWQAFRHQHGPPRQGLGALVGLLVGHLSHWNTRSEAFVIGAIVVIASVCALWLKKRLYGHLSYWDAIVPMLFFTRVQWETYLGSANPAHGSLPLLLIMLYGVAWTIHRDVVKYPLVLVLNFLAINTGFGLFMGFITPVLLAFDGYRKFKSVPPANPWYALVACAVSVATLGQFFWGYVRSPAAACFSFPYAHPTHYILFI